MADQITVSSTANPYQAGVYSAGSNSKNTMDVNSFIKLLAAQLSNQDMTSPMDNSEMMSQMTNMAMVQSLTAMTESLNTSAAVTTQTYAGSLIGQEVTVAVTDPDTGTANGVKYGKVVSVDFTKGDPVVRLEGDDTGYKMSSVLGVGKLQDKTDKPEASGEKDPDELAAKALDDKTFEVTLVNDLNYFEELCAFPAMMPVREDMIEKAGDQWTFDTATYISNGAYKLKEWTHNSQIVVEKNENYYDVENLGPETITFKLMDDQNAMLSGFNSGELDFIEDVPQAEIANLIASGDMKIVDYIGTYYVCFQTQKAPFDDPRVRKAFSLAIDRTYIVNQVTQSGQVEAGGFVPSGVYDADGAEGDDFRTVGGDYYKPTDADYEANCDEARQLLADAGYPNGEGFPVVEYLYNTSDAHKAVAEALQFMWEEELGVKVTLNNQEWASFLQTRKNGDYSIARNGWISDYNDPVSFLDMWVTGGGNNDAQYSNPDYDNLINQAKAESDPAARMKLLHQAEDILVGQDYVVDPLYFYTQKYMLRDGIDGMYYTPLGYYFFAYTSQK